jgi:tetratricopeptide (TPR) repeat protein
MPFTQRTRYKCLVFLLVVLLLPIRAFSDDLKNKAEESPLNCAHYLLTKSSEENDPLRIDFMNLSRVYWRLGRYSEALQELELVDGTNEKTYLLMFFADEYVKKNRPDEAATLLRKAFETAQSGYADDEMKIFAKMATQLVSLGKDLEAFHIVYAIEEIETQANALTEMANEYLRQGKNDKALELLAEALPLVKESNYQDMKALGLAKIGVTYALAGKRTEAEEILSQAVETDRTATSHDNIIPEKFAYVIANGYLALGAEERIPGLFEKPEEGQAWLALNYLKRGEKEKAKKMLSEIEAQYKKDCDNVALVDWYLRFEDYETAGQVIRENDCADSENKFTAALNIARASIGKRPPQEIADVLTFAMQKALMLSKYEPDNVWRPGRAYVAPKADELAAVAEVMMDAGCFDLAYLAINAIGKPYYKAQMLSDFARRQIKNLPRQKVLEMLEQAWQIARKPTTNRLDMSRYEVRVAIASRYAEAGEKAKAAELFAQILEFERVDAGKGPITYLLHFMITLGEQMERHNVPVNASLKKTLRKIIKVWHDD